MLFVLKDLKIPCSEQSSVENNLAMLAEHRKFVVFFFELCGADNERVDGGQTLFFSDAQFCTVLYPFALAHFYRVKQTGMV